MGANSLSLPVPVVVVLCFLFVVSSSHAACFDDCIKSFTKGSSPSAKAIAQVVGCTTKCALGVGELKTTTEELISLDNKLPCKYNPCYRACRALGGSKDFCAKKCSCTQLTSLINNDHDQEMTEEQISLDDKLMASCKYSVCYRACRAVGGSKESCAKKCHCSLPTSFTNERDQEMTEELISLDNKLMAPCKYTLCYRGCRAVGGSKEYCAKKCNCSLSKFSPFELDQKVKMTEEEADDEAASAASA